MGFREGFLILFVVGLVPVFVSPVGGFTPRDGPYDRRWERDGKVIGTDCTRGLGFCERRSR